MECHEALRQLQDLLAFATAGCGSSRLRWTAGAGLMLCTRMHGRCTYPTAALDHPMAAVCRHVALQVSLALACHDPACLCHDLQQGEVRGGGCLPPQLLPVHTTAARCCCGNHGGAQVSCHCMGTSARAVVPYRQRFFLPYEIKHPVASGQGACDCATSA